jgi:hypothetical protein
MKIRRTALRAGLAGTVALGAIVASQFTAGADPAPSASDVVGVGSDIVQNSLDFLADGVDGYPGYNAAGNVNRLANFDATADANGRNAFLDPALGLSGNNDLLNPTVTLRGGTSPVTRPNGGSVGLLALTFDGDTENQFQLTSGTTPALNWGKPQLVDFARSPNLPTNTGTDPAKNNQLAADKNLGTQLHSVRFAIDQQYIAAATTTNAPSYLSPVQIAAIYKGYWTDWRQVPGSPHYESNWSYTDNGSQDPITGSPNVTNVAFPHTGSAPSDGFDSSAEPIYAEYPQDGAGVLKIFATALTAANGKHIPGAGVGVNFSASAFTSTSTLASTGLATGSSTLHAVQQNDPTTITGLGANSINAIVPFPNGRYKLIQSGYFNTPQSGASQYYNSTSGNGGSATPPKTTVAGIQLLKPSAGNHPAGYSAGSAETDTYDATIPYYVVYRASDENDAPWQPGSTLNWVQTLFYNPGGPAPFLASAPGQALIEHLGLTPSYSYLGNAAVDNTLNS